LWETTFPIPIADTIEAKNIILSLSGREASLQRKRDATPTPAFCISIWIPLVVVRVEEESFASSEAAINDGSDVVAQQDTDTVTKAEAEAEAGAGTDTDTGVCNDTDIDATTDKDTPIIDIDDTRTGHNTASVITTATTTATVSTVTDLSVEDLQRIINQTQEVEVVSATTASPNDDDVDVDVDVDVVRRRTHSTRRTVELAEHKPFQHKSDGRYARTFKVYYHDCTTKAEAKQYHKILRENTIPTYFPNVIIR